MHFPVESPSLWTPLLYALRFTVTSVTSLLPRVWLEGVSLSVSLDPGVGARSLPPLRHASLTATSQSAPSPSPSHTDTSPVSVKEDTDPLSLATLRQTSPPAKEDASGGVPGADVGEAQVGGDDSAQGASEDTGDAAGDGLIPLDAEPSGARATPDTWSPFADDDDVVDGSMEGQHGMVDGGSVSRRPKM